MNISDAPGYFKRTFSCINLLSHVRSLESFRKGLIAAARPEKRCAETGALHGVMPLEIREAQAVSQKEQKDWCGGMKIIQRTWKERKETMARRNENNLRLKWRVVVSVSARVPNGGAFSLLKGACQGRSF